MEDHWEQPPACRHDGDHYTDRRITDAHPRTVCSICGAEIATEPGTPEGWDEAFTGTGGSEITFHRVDGEPTPDPVATMIAQARDQHQLLRVTLDGEVVGYLNPANATRDDRGHHIQLIPPDTPTEPADPPTS